MVKLFPAGIMKIWKMESFNWSKNISDKLSLFDKKFVDLFAGFKHFGKTFVAWLLMGLYQCLWFCVPFAGPFIAFVKTFSYSQTDLVLRDNPELSANEAITKSREIMYGNTVIGPHKDNFSFYLNESNLSLYGSQGQLKMSVLALKLAEIDVFKSITGDNPILLLDDIFSE